MKKSNLLRNLVADQGSLLIPHIDAYLARGKFPEKWVIEIPNVKPERDYGEAKIRFSAREDALLSEDVLYNKLKMEKIPELISAQTRKIFDVGSFWHGYLQAILLDMGFVDEEGIEKYIIKKIERPEGVAYSSGLGDLVGVRIPSHGEWLIDIKTMNDDAFKNPQPYVMDKYNAQVRLYGDWFGYDKLMILCIQKGYPHAFKEIIVQQDSAFLDEVYAKWVAVMNRIYNG